MLGSRGAWALAIAVAMLATQTGMAQLDPPLNEGWYQVAGGPGRPGVAFLDGPLDVVANATVLGDGFVFSAEGRRPPFDDDTRTDDAVGARWTAFPIIATPVGLFASVERADGSGMGPIGRSLTCAFVLLPVGIGPPTTMSNPEPCVAGYRPIAYDPVMDSVIVCYAGREGSAPLLAALDPAAFAERWSVPSTGLARRPTTGPWSCGDAALDPSTRRVFFGATNDGYGAVLALVDADSGALLNATLMVSLVEALAGALPIPPPDDAIHVLGLTVTTTGVVVTGVDALEGPFIAWQGKDGGNASKVTMAALSSVGLVAFAREPQRTGWAVSQYGAASGPQIAVVAADYLYIFDTSAQAVGYGSAMSRSAASGEAYSSVPPVWWADQLVVTHSALTMTIDTSDGSELWAKGFIGTLLHTLVGAPDELVLLFGNTGSPMVLQILDLRTGALRQAHELSLVRRTADEGGGLYATPQGELLAWNGTSIVRLGLASPERVPGLALSNAFPAVGEIFTVDLTRPRHGTPFSYLVSWGDGGTETVRGETRLRHAYSDEGIHALHVTARFPDDTTGTAVATMDVGGTPPADLTPLQQAFSPDNQNTTWGVIGILIALAGALLALARNGHKRRRFKRELRAIEAVHEQTKGSPRQCEAALNERRAHVRGLLADGRLDEGQVGVLLARIDELHRGLRLSMIDERLAFLPFGMVEHLRSILADSEVTAWEHRHFVEALERATLLTAEQKAQVRLMIDEWFARDAGRPGGSQGRRGGVHD